MANRKIKDKRTNNDLGRITLKTKDKATRTILKHMVNWQIFLMMRHIQLWWPQTWYE